MLRYIPSFLELKGVMKVYIVSININLNQEEIFNYINTPM